MHTGIAILNLFAAVWASAALQSIGAANWIWLPLVISAGILGLSWRAAPNPPAPPPEVARSIARTVGLWSVIEAVLIAIGIAAMFWLGTPRFIGPVVGVIVGLHFIALAYGLPFQAYYATGLALVAVSAVAVILTGETPLTLTGFGAALVLWCTSLWIGFRSGRVRG